MKRVSPFCRNSLYCASCPLIIYAKVTNISTIALPSFSDQADAHQRVVVAATISTSCGHVQAVSTHLSLSDRGRIRQTRALRNFLDGCLQAGVPQILGGDFNAEPKSSTLSPFWEDRPSSMRFIDSWTKAQGEGLTFASFRPTKRIDYILMRNGALPVRATTSADTWLDGDAEMKASDHLMVVADIVIHSLR